MTLNSALKKQVRARMSATGENYTTALRAVTAGSESALAAALKPGTVTLAVNGGGQTNAALFLPELLRLHGLGHPLVIAPMTRSEGVPELPELLDLIAGARRLSARDALELAEDRDGLRRAVEEARLDTAFWVNGAMSASRLMAELQRIRLSSGGRAPVLYVQDVQEFGAVVVSPYDDEVAQLTRLGEVAVAADAIVAAGHCVPALMIHGWTSAAAAANQTFVIGDAGSDGDERRFALRRFERTVERESFDWAVDHGPFRWRQELFARSRS